MNAYNCISDDVILGKDVQLSRFINLYGCEIGDGTKIGASVEIQKNARVGKFCKISSHTFICEGVTIEDDVFLGPSCVLTNVTNPRSQVVRRALYEKTLIRRGATIGANATVVCGLTLGRYCLIAAGTVVTRDVPDYAQIVGVPGRQRGWVSRHGHPLRGPIGSVLICPESGLRYQETTPGTLRCLDLDEEAPLPPELAEGRKPYREFNRRG